MRRKDTVDHVGKTVGRLIIGGGVAFAEALSGVEVAVVVRRQGKPLAHGFRVKTLAQM